MLRYTKLEGCGNDFVVVDLRRELRPQPGSTPSRGGDGVAADGDGSASADSPLAAEALCDRHFGVGADGVLALLPPVSDGAVARMRVWNADGSEAEMCGNGIRCVAKFLYEHDPAARRDELPIDTGAGLLRCGITARERRARGVDADRPEVIEVSVAMGRPRLQASEIPVLPTAAAGAAAVAGQVAGRVVEHEIALDGRPFRFTAVSMGNPHAVIFVDDGEPARLRELAERYGPVLERHPWFPRRTNAEFARRVAPDHIELVVWERGCGITMACGTGACATAVAACLTGRASVGADLQVSLPGGRLVIRVEPDLAGVTLRGPASEVFEGQLDLAALIARQRQRRGEAG